MVGKAVLWVFGHVCHNGVRFQDMLGNLRQSCSSSHT